MQILYPFWPVLQVESGSEGVVIAAVRDPGRLCGLSIADGSLVHQAGESALAVLPGIPCAITADERRGVVYVNVLRGPPQQLHAAASPAANVEARDVISHPRHILAFKWRPLRGASSARRGTLEPLRPVEVPTDDASVPRPLAVIPPSPGRHVSHLIVGGEEDRGGRFYLPFTHCLSRWQVWLRPTSRSTCWSCRHVAWCTRTILQELQRFAGSRLIPVEQLLL